MAERLHRPREGTSRLLLFVIGTLLLGVIVADVLCPLGLAVWVFYMVPLGACLFSRSPLLPLQVALAVTALMALLVVKPFGGEALVERWIALGNRSMYVAMLWPVAYMIRRLITSRQLAERDEWLEGTRASLLSSLQGELSVQEVSSRALGGLSEAIGVPVGALYLRTGSNLERAAAHGLELEGTPARFAVGEGLVGRAALGGGTQVLRDVPAGFLRVQAGIGASEPRHVAIAPLRADNQTVAVAAVGSLNEIQELDLELIRRASEPMAMALTSARHKEQLRELLDESQRQQAQLEAQQAELEAQQAELEASNEEMAQTNALMEAQTTELEQQRGELVVQRETADRASRYKSEFLANMSHELRTPLNSSLILARLLADNREGNLSADQVRSAETIYAAGNDLLVLINDILDLAKIEAGRADVALEPVGIAELSAALERAFRPVSADKKIGFQIRRGPGLPARIVSDGRRIEQVLKNLLSNAFKFTERGEVELSIAVPEPGWVAFAVRDTGIGIARDQQDVIFEAFRQADGTTSRKYGGTGLGLSISRELAQLLSGRIDVQSRPGQGSTFTLTLPFEASAPHASAAPPALPAPAPRKSDAVARRDNGAREPAASAEATPLRAPSPLGVLDDRERLQRTGRLILAIEDDLAFARILFDLCHELDFDCVVAGTADEGLELARRLPPSGVLLDVGLPDMSGLSVLERLKRDPSTRHIPVHMVSVSDNVQTALELGAIGYALKPVARDELSVAIQKLDAEHARTTRRVLIVEDDPNQRNSLMKLLATDGVQLVTAGTVQEALAELERASVDCMVLDLTLPDGSGYDLLEKMASGTRHSFPPVIVYTGRDIDRQDEERLRRYSHSIIVKGARSPERLLDEVTLFLHKVESSLPPEQRRMLADARQREAVFEGRRILVVEDDVRNVFALSKVLEPRGAKIEISRNGREALAALDRHSDIDLVLMDLMMPEMDGLTAMREIRKNPALRRLPIIALTAKAMPDDREQALAAGANDYMAKPFEVDKLVSLCRVWLPR
ncbi:MAG TPA: response regulator [Polyangiaceae bacterium]|nr:response regulator [Polyangiaceae bacterium]